MLYIVLTLCGTVLGYLTGTYLSQKSFQGEDWKILRWNKDIMGYRPVPIGKRIYRNENVLASLKIESSILPPEGIVVEG